MCQNLCMPCMSVPPSKDQGKLSEVCDAILCLVQVRGRSCSLHPSMHRAGEARESCLSPAFGKCLMPPCHAQVFGEAAPNQPADGVSLSVEPPQASELSKRINALLSSLRSGRSRYASCYVVRQGG